MCCTSHYSAWDGHRKSHLFCPTPPLRADRLPLRLEVVQEVERLVRQGRVQMLGVIRQELLSGIRTGERFAALRDELAQFPDLPMTSEDHVEAARAFNRCRSRGVQGNVVDMLVCATAMRRDLSIYTLDRDFDLYEKILRFKRHHRKA